MEHTITVVGIGPGCKDYLTPIASRCIQEAQVLIGSKRALDTLAPAGIETRVIDKDIDALLAYIEEVSKKIPITVMVSGDPGFYSLLAALKKRFALHRLTVIPGISSVQLAFARVGEIWQDAALLSMHGRIVGSSELTFIPGKKLGLLTDELHNPAYIAKFLLEEGWPEKAQVWLCTKLSYEDEEIIETTLAAAQATIGFAHSVMVVKT